MNSNVLRRDVKREYDVSLTRWMLNPQVTCENMQGVAGGMMLLSLWTKLGLAMLHVILLFGCCCIMELSQPAGVLHQCTLMDARTVGNCRSTPTMCPDGCQDSLRNCRSTPPMYPGGCQDIGNCRSRAHRSPIATLTVHTVFAILPRLLLNHHTSCW